MKGAVAGIRKCMILGLVVAAVLAGTLFGWPPRARADSESVYYLYNDHLGTPQAATNASGSVVWEASYRPYGSAGAGNQGIEQNLRLPGQYYDAESGLHYNYQRTYHPGLGRYLEPDPLGQHDSANVYPYVGSNPINLFDPLGLFESPWYLNWVPGQHQYDLGVTALEEGQYGSATVYFAAMVGEQALFALTLGESGAIKAGGQSAISIHRATYLERVDDLCTEATEIHGAYRWLSPEASAEYAVRKYGPLRNQLKLDIRQEGSWAAARAADLRNLVVYGNRAGPSPEQMLSKYGSWERALEALGRTSQTVNRWTGN